MHTQKYMLEDIATIISGLPTIRYLDREDSYAQKVISNISKEDIDQKFKTEEADLGEIREQFYSKEHDILYKLQQQMFAKEITTETGAVIPNNYIIIRPNEELVNPTYLVHYLNSPKVEYEIRRQIDTTRIMKVNASILKQLTIILPPREIQDKYSELMTKIRQRIEIKKKSIQVDEDLINSLFDIIIGDQYELQR
ncbi:MAG: hypothetical protein BZ138_00025 [Methanosphaera sp. rholeuAM270]|nr:MAG: hypothetical protein BZ138_00025 [Methanosphaera sp. rholeuAM270]